MLFCLLYSSSLYYLLLLPVIVLPLGKSFTFL
nr:MAG TPA: hypothetical protein [Caudoviricetes sp.]